MARAVGKIRFKMRSFEPYRVSKVSFNIRGVSVFGRNAIEADEA